MNVAHVIVAIAIVGILILCRKKESGVIPPAKGPAMATRSGRGHF
jgi:hypothetical protein